MRLNTPMLWILLPLLGGVLTSSWVESELWITLSLIVICTLLSLLTQRKGFIYATIFSFAMLLPSLKEEDTPLPQGSEIVVALRPINSYSAKILALKIDNSWHNTHHTIAMSGETENLSIDSISICRGTIKPYNGVERVYITTHISSIDPPHHTLSQRAHNWAIKRLKRLSLEPEEMATTLAIGVGERGGLSAELKNAYARSGASHLLALSGMHIGILLILIRALIYLFPLLRYGNVVGSIVAIVMVWTFAYTAGLSDSVMRAAWMFSLLELSRALSRSYKPINSLFSTAVIMIIFDPEAIYDLGFQLSFIAVAAIIVWASPLVRRLSTGFKLIDLATDTVIMGIVASIATLPLVSFAFGYISILSPLTTPLLLITLSAIIFASVVWITLPIPALAPLFSYIIEVSTTIQNYIVRLCATWEWGYIEYRLPSTALYAIYFIYLVVSILWLRHLARPRKRDYFAE